LIDVLDVDGDVLDVGGDVRYVQDNVLEVGGDVLDVKMIVLMYNILYTIMHFQFKATQNIKHNLSN
jgi:hypothetical protein